MSTIVDFRARHSQPPPIRPGEALATILTWAALHGSTDSPREFLSLVVQGSRQYAARHGLDGLRDALQRPEHRLLLALAEFDPDRLA
jgi:hypothetical protein